MLQRCVALNSSLRIVSCKITLKGPGGQFSDDDFYFLSRFFHLIGVGTKLRNKECEGYQIFFRQQIIYAIWGKLEGNSIRENHIDEWAWIGSFWSGLQSRTKTR